MPRRQRSLFQFQSGWLILLAGLGMIVCCVLIPAQHNLQNQQHLLRLLKHDEVATVTRLQAHADFLEQLKHQDMFLLQRLASSQLNLVPIDDHPILLTASNSASVTDWIDASIEFDRFQIPVPSRQSLLSRLVTGPLRLWVLALSVMCVFVGLLLDPAVARRMRMGRWLAIERAQIHHSAWLNAGTVNRAIQTQQDSMDIAEEEKDEDNKDIECTVDAFAVSTHENHTLLFVDDLIDLDSVYLVDAGVDVDTDMPKIRTVPGQLEYDFMNDEFDLQNELQILCENNDESDEQDTNAGEEEDEWEYEYVYEDVDVDDDDDSQAGDEDKESEDEDEWEYEYEDEEDELVEIANSGAEEDGEELLEVETGASHQPTGEIEKS